MTRRDDPEPCVLMVVTDLDITVASVDDMKPTLADMKAKLVACDRPAECQRVGRHKHRKAKRHDHDSV
jgi:hypothetical protein